MIRTATMMIGGLLLLLVACPLHALAKISPAPAGAASPRLIERRQAGNDEPPRLVFTPTTERLTPRAGARGLMDKTYRAAGGMMVKLSAK